MMHLEHDTAIFRHRVESIAAMLCKRDLVGSRKGIAEVMAMDMDAPEPHNLLGILYELAGEYQAARKHYRAAYALDPTYKPCCRNLERVTSYSFTTNLSDMDFGMGVSLHGVELGKPEKNSQQVLG